MSDVIDLLPLLKRKSASKCRHASAEVDDDAASLTCANCGVEIDPWWFIRRLAADAEREERRKTEQVARYNAWCETANATIARLSGEIAELTATKNRLWNERVDGSPLGSLVGRRRSRARGRQ